MRLGGPSSSTSSLIVCKPSVAVACITAELIARNILRHPEKYMDRKELQQI